jgi:hypothetical protein
MPERIPDISSSTIVLVGSFNPKIFQPEWFARQGLLAQEQVDTAEIKVIIPQFCQFETEQFTIAVTTDKFVAGSKPSTSHAPLRDIVQGTFFILEHTPVTGMGLNRHMHFSLGSEDDWHRLGHKLAPKDGWNGVLVGAPGMLSLSIITRNENDNPPTQYMVRVEPSTQLKFGAYFDTNSHRPAPESKPLAELMKTLGDKWEEANAYSLRIANHILDWAGAL